MNRAELRSNYYAAVENASVFPLDGWSTVRVTGADRASFLHNMCTNDVRALQPGGGCEAFFTDVKGKILGHAFVLAGDDAIQLVGVPRQADSLIRHLDRYIIREAVHLADASGEVHWLQLLGAHSRELLARWTPELDAGATPWAHCVGVLADCAVQVVHCNLPWCGGSLIGCRPHDALAVADQLHRLGAGHGAPETWHAIRIESGWPLYGVDFDAANLPQEVGRDALAIHFRKGCYLGQETVARIDALGHVNKRLAILQSTGDHVPEPGTELTQGDQSAGRITASCWSPTYESPLALGMIRRGANEVGQTLTLAGTKAIIVSPISLP